MASNLVYIIWAVSGAFILHFLLSNFLTVLLRPGYEQPVETVADIVKKDIIPILWPEGESWISFFADSPDPNYQEISRRILHVKDWDEYYNLVHKVTSTGLYTEIGTVPTTSVVTEEEHKNWYRSSEMISGDNPYAVHLLNKKWPLKKVLRCSCNMNENIT